jgi:hypothetical protein
MAKETKQQKHEREIRETIRKSREWAGKLTNPKGCPKWNQSKVTELLPVRGEGKEG